MLEIPMAIKDFRSLARWLVETKHDGHYYRMAKALQVSPGLPYQWGDGVVKRPSDETMMRLVEVYGLDPRELIEVVHGLRRRPLLGSTVRRLLAAVTIGAGLAVQHLQPLDEPRGSWAAVPLPVVTRPAGMPLIRSWLGTWRWWGALADDYLARAWRCGLTSFRSWPRVPIPGVYGT